MSEQTTGTYAIEHGETWFHPAQPADRAGHALRRVCGPSDTLAVAFDPDNGLLHKHGSSEEVVAWADAAMRKLVPPGHTAPRAHMTVLSFPPFAAAVGELNACISAPGRIRGLEGRLHALGAEVFPGRWP